MIIGSVTPPPITGWLWWKAPSKDVIPLAKADLSYDDYSWLTHCGLPPNKRDNLNVLLTLHNEAKNVFSVHISRPEMELSRSYILKQIEFLLTNATNKAG